MNRLQEFLIWNELLTAFEFSDVRYDNGNIIEVFTFNDMIFEKIFNSSSGWTRIELSSKQHNENIVLCAYNFVNKKANKKSLDITIEYEDIPNKPNSLTIQNFFDNEFIPNLEWLVKEGSMKSFSVKYTKK